MTNLIAHKTPAGIELVIDNNTGECYASQRAIARMCERNESTIRTFIGAGKILGIDAEVFTAGGLQGARLYTEHVILMCIAKYNPQFSIVFAMAGLRAYLHQEAGYQVTSTAVAPMSQLQMLAAMATAMAEQEQRTNAQLSEQDARLRAVEYHTTGHADYCSLKAYVNLNNIVMGSRSYSTVGKALVKLSKIMGYEVETVGDARYGKVNTYSIAVLENYFTGE